VQRCIHKRNKCFSGVKCFIETPFLKKSYKKVKREAKNPLKEQPGKSNWKLNPDVKQPNFGILRQREMYYFTEK
jgi:hypothetical protein